MNRKNKRPDSQRSSMHTPQSDMLFQRAQALIPGGVNSPVRAFRAVGGQPLFIAARGRAVPV